MKRTCPRCEGSGQCADCQGQGFVVCVSCEGSGERSSSRGASYPCRNCKGTGKMECNPKCASCEGSGEITEALQRKVRDKYDPQFDRTLPRTALTFAVSFVCIFLYVLGAFKPSAGDWLRANWSNLSNLWNIQPWRMLTYALLHGGLLHLLFNLSTILRIGPVVEGYYGSRRYVLIILLTALIGGLTSALGHQGTPVLSVGLSGVIYGLMGVIGGAYYRYRAFDWHQVSNLLTWIVVWALVSFNWSGSVDHWCHLGGFLAGFAYAWLTRRPSGR
ncbi:rhomboid family intramembrane serine protease [bacterium]|nr:rhomboid family intramembrane serine protease [bacterium]